MRRRQSNEQLILRSLSSLAGTNSLDVGGASTTVIEPASFFNKGASMLKKIERVKK